MLIETAPKGNTRPAALTWDELRAPRLRKLLLATQISLALALIAWWLAFEPIWNSRNLWALFLYCFPSEFLLSIVPHEPVILHFATLYPPLIVTLVSIAGTLIMEAANYHSFHLVAKSLSLHARIEGRMANRVITLFSRAPFLALLVAGLSPIPFYPFRTLVVLTRYPLARYLLAIATSRTPRFFLLAVLGQALAPPNWMLVSLFVCLMVVSVVPFLSGNNGDNG
jgi:membrane protein YqaA with SNARE-associated domain